MRSKKLKMIIDTVDHNQFGGKLDLGELYFENERKSAP